LRDRGIPETMQGRGTENARLTEESIGYMKLFATSWITVMCIFQSLTKIWLFSRNSS